MGDRRKRNRVKNAKMVRTKVLNHFPRTALQTKDQEKYLERNYCKRAVMKSDRVIVVKRKMEKRNPIKYFIPMTVQKRSSSGVPKE